MIEIIFQPKNKIRLILRVRAVTGASLKEAKEFIEGKQRLRLPNYLDPKKVIEELQEPDGIPGDPLVNIRPCIRILQ